MVSRSFSASPKRRYSQVLQDAFEGAGVRRRIRGEPQRLFGREEREGDAFSPQGGRELAEHRLGQLQERRICLLGCGDPLAA